jgi:excisionase family DNA binding protein
MQPELDLAVQRFVDTLAAEMATRIEARLDGLLADRGPQALDVKQAAARLGVSDRTVHQLVMSGKVPSIKVGRRRVIAASTIDRMLAGESLPGSGREPGDYPPPKRAARSRRNATS